MKIFCYWKASYESCGFKIFFKKIQFSSSINLREQKGDQLWKRQNFCLYRNWPPFFHGNWCCSKIGSFKKIFQPTIFIGKLFNYKKMSLEVLQTVSKKCSKKLQILSLLRSISMNQRHYLKKWYDQPWKYESISLPYCKWFLFQFLSSS